MSLRSFKQHVELMGPATHRETSGLVENFQAGVGMTVLNNLEYSNVFWQDFREERRKMVYQGLEQGKWTNNDLTPFIGAARGGAGEFDYNRFAHWARKNGHEGFLTDEEIQERMARQEEVLLGPARDTMERADIGGTMMNMAGTLAGYSLSPITAASMLLPVSGAARGVSLLSRTAVAGGKVAVSEAMLEMVRQPMIMSWRQELGRDYSLEEGLTEVAYAAGGAGLLGSAAELAKGIRRFRLKTKMLKGDLEKLSQEQLEQLEKLLDNNLFPEQKALDHLKRLDEEMKRINNPEPPTPIDEGGARATPSKATPGRGPTPPGGGSPPATSPTPPKGPRPPKSVIEQRVKDLDEQIEIVRREMAGAPGADTYIRELERERDALLSPAGTEKAITERAAAIEQKIKADANVDWGLKLRDIEEQIAKVEKSMPPGPDRQMYLEELEIERSKLEMKRDVQKRQAHNAEMQKMEAQRLARESELADVPPDLENVNVFRGVIDDTGKMVEQPSTLREAVEQINEEADQASKAWECLNGG